MLPPHRIYAEVQGERTAGEPLEAEVLQRHLDLVRHAAHHLIARLPPQVQLEDLLQAGLIGLLEAWRKFDPAQGVPFEAFAQTRVRGAMLDELRKLDWAPRALHRRAREAAAALWRVEARVGREATDLEVATELGISLHEYHRTLREQMAAQVLSLDEGDEALDGRAHDLPDAAPGPSQQLDREQFEAALAEAIADLPERERLVVALYYQDELNQHEIAAVLGVTESRVSQIHSKAMLRLRGKLGAWR